MSGIGSAIAPPLVIRQVEGGVVADAALGPAYEGPPSYLRPTDATAVEHG